MTWPVIPRPQFVDAEEQQLVLQSDWRQGMLHTQRVDPATVRVWTLRWPLASEAIAIAVRAHAQEHLSGKEFSWTPPGGSPVNVIYDEESIDIDQRSSRTWSIRLRLREALVSQT